VNPLRREFDTTAAVIDQLLTKLRIPPPAPDDSL
jgi:hypothetical protein